MDEISRGERGRWKGSWGWSEIEGQLDVKINRTNTMMIRKGKECQMSNHIHWLLRRNSLYSSYAINATLQTGGNITIPSIILMWYHINRNIVTLNQICPSLTSISSNFALNLKKEQGQGIRFILARGFQSSCGWWNKRNGISMRYYLDNSLVI